MSNTIFVIIIDITNCYVIYRMRLDTILLTYTSLHIKELFYGIHFFCMCYENVSLSKLIS